MGTRLETYIHSLDDPKKYLAVIDSPNILFKDVKRCQKGLRHFVIPLGKFFADPASYEAGTASISQAR